MNPQGAISGTGGAREAISVEVVTTSSKLLRDPYRRRAPSSLESDDAQWGPSYSQTRPGSRLRFEGAKIAHAVHHVAGFPVRRCGRCEGKVGSTTHTSMLQQSTLSQTRPSRRHDDTTGIFGAPGRMVFSLNGPLFPAGAAGEMRDFVQLPIALCGSLKGGLTKRLCPGAASVIPSPAAESPSHWGQRAAMPNTSWRLETSRRGHLRPWRRQALASRYLDRWQRPSLRATG